MKKKNGDFNKTTVAIVAIIAAGIIILAYMFMGDSRPKVDIPTENGPIHIEKKR